MLVAYRHPLFARPFPRGGLPIDIIASADGGRDDIDAVKRFIEEHLSEPFGVGDLSRVAELTRPHFSRVFKEQEGMPPWEYVLDQRARKAAELLDGGAPPSEAALESGFYDQSHLNRVFRRVHGETPGEYRKRTNVQDGEEGAE